MIKQKVRIKENIVSLYLHGKDLNNEAVQRTAVQLSGMRDREFPLMGEYLHARDGMVVVIEFNGMDWTIPAAFVEMVKKTKRKVSCPPT